MPSDFGKRERHRSLSPLFDLSVSAYFLDFALVPLAVAGLLWLATTRDLSLTASGMAVAAGIMAWSLAEYWIHRLAFHGDTAFEPMHQMHHALPKEMIGVASWATFVGFAGVWLIAQVFAGTQLGSAFAAGFMLGYLAYCIIHVRMHHGNRDRFGRYVSFMFEHHASHHRGGKGNFGVSSPIWDFAFRTRA